MRRECGSCYVLRFPAAALKNSRVSRRLVVASPEGWEAFEKARGVGGGLGAGWKLGGEAKLLRSWHTVSAG